MARSCEGCGSRMPPFFPRTKVNGEMLCTTCVSNRATARAAASLHSLRYSSIPVSASIIEEVNGFAFEQWPYYEKAGKDAYVTGGLIRCPRCTAQISYESVGPMNAWMDRHSTPGSMFSCRTLTTAKLAHDSGDGESLFHCPFCGAGQLVGRSDGTTECDFCGTAFTVQVQPSLSAQPQTIDGEPVTMPDMPGVPGGEPGVPEEEIAADSEETELDPADGEDDMDDLGKDPSTSENPFQKSKPNPFQSARKTSSYWVYSEDGTSEIGGPYELYESAKRAMGEFSVRGEGALQVMRDDGMGELYPTGDRISGSGPLTDNPGKSSFKTAETFSSGEAFREFLVGLSDIEILNAYRDFRQAIDLRQPLNEDEKDSYQVVSGEVRRRGLIASASFKTADGASLSEDDYIRHLAIRHAPDRNQVIAEVRGSRKA